MGKNMKYGLVILVAVVLLMLEKAAAPFEMGLGALLCAAAFAVVTTALLTVGKPKDFEIKRKYSKAI